MVGERSTSNERNTKFTMFCVAAPSRQFTNFCGRTDMLYTSS